MPYAAKILAASACLFMFFACQARSTDEAAPSKEVDSKEVDSTKDDRAPKTPSVSTDDQKPPVPEEEDVLAPKPEVPGPKGVEREEDKTGEGQGEKAKQERTLGGKGGSGGGHIGKDDTKTDGVGKKENDKGPEYREEFGAE